MLVVEKCFRREAKFLSLTRLGLSGYFWLKICVPGSGEMAVIVNELSTTKVELCVLHLDIRNMFPQG